MKSSLRALLALSVVALAGGVWFARSRAGAPAASRAVGAASAESVEPESAFVSQLKTGEEAFAVDPEAVHGIDYVTRQRQLRAERASPRDPFQISVTDATGKLLERCSAGKPWDAVMPALASLRVRRVLAPSEARALWARSGADAARLRIKDTLEGDPSEFQLLALDEGVVVRDAGGVFVSSWPKAVLDTLSAGCH
ncbi:MAG: hypothetical protein ACOY0T_03095 [Myxococcota bacterium]